MSKPTDNSKPTDKISQNVQTCQSVQRYGQTWLNCSKIHIISPKMSRIAANANQGVQNCSQNQPNRNQRERKGVKQNIIP